MLSTTNMDQGVIEGSLPKACVESKDGQEDVRALNAFSPSSFAV